MCSLQNKCCKSNNESLMLQNTGPIASQPLQKTNLKYYSELCLFQNTYYKVNSESHLLQNKCFAELQPLRNTNVKSSNESHRLPSTCFKSNSESGPLQFLFFRDSLSGSQINFLYTENSNYKLLYSICTSEVCFTWKTTSKIMIAMKRQFFNNKYDYLMSKTINKPWRHNKTTGEKFSIMTENINASNIEIVNLSLIDIYRQQVRAYVWRIVKELEETCGFVVEILILLIVLGLFNIVQCVKFCIKRRKRGE